MCCHVDDLCFFVLSPGYVYLDRCADVFIHTQVGKSRFTVVHMENDTIMNK